MMIWWTVESKSKIPVRDEFTPWQLFKTRKEARQEICRIRALLTLDVNKLMVYRIRKYARVDNKDYQA